MEKKERKKHKERREVAWNRATIRDAMIKLTTDLKRRPTLEELSRETDLSIPTIRKYIGDIKIAELKGELKLLTDDVLLAIYRSAMKGSSASQKLWLQFIEDWNEKTETHHSGEIIAPAPPTIIKIVKK